MAIAIVGSVLGALVGALVMHVLTLPTRGRPLELRYSRVSAIGALVFAIGGPAAVIVGMLYDPSPMSWGGRATIAVAGLVYVALTGFLAIEFLRVAHTFDEEGFVYRSPWTRHRTLAWAEVVRVRWRPMLSVLELSDGSGSAFTFAPMLSGLEAFARTALGRVPEAAIERNARCVLLLFQHGFAHALIGNSAQPAKTLARLVPDHRG